jgi:nucleotide-binding universal stress UspA family protein
MSPYDFTNVLVPVDGSEGSEKALDCALSICAALGARLTALAVEGKLPAYAASLGEVEEVKLEKDQFFRDVLERAREQARDRGVELHAELRHDVRRSGARPDHRPAGPRRHAVRMSHDPGMGRA